MVSISVNAFEDLGQGGVDPIVGEVGRAFFGNDTDIPKTAQSVSI
jgi:hypothetical protein